jgi:O-acetyl-ADP-ribose deacetylase (regulator of RNase III)
MNVKLLNCRNNAKYAITQAIGNKTIFSMAYKRRKYMIKVVEGNLLDATEDIIGHQVNCKGVMGSGVAKQLRDKYGGLFREYKAYLNTYGYGKYALGKCLFVSVVDGKIIANLFGQLDYGYNGQFTSYTAIKESLGLLKSFAVDHKYSVALPYKIGSDRGGADWNEVYGIIDKVFEDYEVTLYKYNG